MIEQVEVAVTLWRNLVKGDWERVRREAFAEKAKSESCIRLGICFTAVGAIGLIAVLMITQVAMTFLIPLGVALFGIFCIVRGREELILQKNIIKLAQPTLWGGFMRLWCGLSASAFVNQLCEGNRCYTLYREEMIEAILHEEFFERRAGAPWDEKIGSWMSSLIKPFMI